MLGCSGAATGEAVHVPQRPARADEHTAGAPGASESERKSLRDPPAALPPSTASTSIGSVTNGRLQGGVPLPDQGKGFRFNDRRDEQARYGTVETVRAIMRAAAMVEDAMSGSQLVVNDIGLPHGGKIAHHGSHRAGRDADILFYLHDGQGRPLRSVGAPLDPDGVGYDFGDLAMAEDDVCVHFDAARTFRFVRALLEQPDSAVQRIFVVEHLRAKLLAEAERSDAPAALIARFAEVTCQPGYAHDDHLHIRWFCSEEDVKHGCEDVPPIYPWRAEALRAAGVEPQLAKRVRAEDPAPVVTEQEAERAVHRQKPHRDVIAFLERRKGWTKQPHPGRPYCP
jgi:penicillin-insensitive murein DD-endopeptidase